jgi:hypothetical protein
VDFGHFCGVLARAKQGDRSLSVLQHIATSLATTPVSELARKAEQRGLIVRYVLIGKLVSVSTRQFHSVSCITKLAQIPTQNTTHLVF